jgi:hypothetical protein
MTEENTNEPLVLLKLLMPFLAATAAATLLVGAVLVKFMPVATFNVSIVTFDVLKFTNAQRAIASTFLRPGADISKVNEVLLKLPERTREVIKEVAGKGTLVVIKQAVVQGQTADITDEVLKRLGLPVDVPTSDATAYNLDVAPTMFRMAPQHEPTRAEPSTRPQVLP